MKFTYIKPYGLGVVTYFADAEHAFHSAAEPGPYSYEGQLEGLRERIDVAVTLNARLFSALIDKGIFTVDEAAGILGAGYRARED